MTATIGAIFPGQRKYYLSKYYAGSEASTSSMWLGCGAKAFDLSGPVEDSAFLNLTDGLSPDGTRDVVQHQKGKPHQCGWDVTLSPPKDFGVLVALATPELRERLLSALWTAAKDTVHLIEETCAFTRRGKGGREIEKVDLLVSAFCHLTARATKGHLPDPQPHVHLVIHNVGVREDGTTGTILSKPLYLEKKEIGRRFRRLLARELERIGIPVLTREGNTWEIAGVPRALKDEFSKRGKEVKAYLNEKGESGGKAAAKAVLKTRSPKTSVDLPELLDAWQEVGRRHGFDHERVSSLFEQHPDLLQVEKAKEGVKKALDAITERQSYFMERELARHTEVMFETLPQSAIRQAVREVFSDPRLVAAVGSLHGEERFTSKEMFKIEKKLISHMKALSDDHSHRVSQELVDKVLSKRRGFTAEQVTVIRDVTLNASSLAMICAHAGAEETGVVTTICEVFKRNGYEVIGATPTGKQAQELSERAEIRAVTLAKLIGIPDKGVRGDLQKGPLDSIKHAARQIGREALGKTTWKENRVVLGKNKLLVINGAAMIGTKALEPVLHAARKARCKVLLIGDPMQLQSPSAGGPFKSLSERVGYSELTEIVRQRDPRDRENVARLRRGDTPEVLNDLEERGLLSVADTKPDAMKDLIGRWRRERHKKALIIAGPNEDVALLNQLAQAELRRDGELGGFRVRLGRDQARKGGLYLGTPCLRTSREEIYERDRVLFTRRSVPFGVENGSFGTVLRIDHLKKTLTVRLDNEKVVVVPLRYYPKESIRLGYAVTTHRVLGTTVSHAYVLVGGFMQDRHLSYTQLSRARENTALFTYRPQIESIVFDLAAHMARVRQKDLAHDLVRLHEREQGQSIEIER